MKLFSDTRTVLQWLLRVLDQCFRVVRGISATVVTYSVIARATRMLAFLLPLKVILLAGSDGVPRYFQAIISPDQKDVGVAVLSAAAIVSYALTLILEARTKTLAERGSTELLEASDVMSLVSNQRTQAQGFYARIMGLTAGFLFAFTGLAILAAMNPVLAAWLIVLGSMFFAITALALRGITPLRRTWLSGLITDRLGNYLSILSSITFLSSFLVILFPFVVGSSGNILIAIISVVLMRQVLSAFTGSIKDVVALSAQRALIDTLVFPNSQFQRAEPEAQRTLRDLFGRAERGRVIGENISDLVGPDGQASIRWRDSPIRGVGVFDIDIGGASPAIRHLRQYVFPPRLRRLMENEDVLFKHVERDRLGAPPVVKRYLHGDHDCVVFELKGSQEPAAARWDTLNNEFIVRLWGVQPPPQLVKKYRSSHRILPERLTDAFAARLDIAADGEGEAELLERFRASLPAMQAAMAASPLRLQASSFIPGSVVAGPDEDVQVLGWGHWALEPVGAGLPRNKLRPRQLNRLVKLLHQSEPSLAESGFGVPHLRLAARGALLENAVTRGSMKLALRMGAGMLADLEAIGRAADAAAGQAAA